MKVFYLGVFNLALSLFYNVEKAFAPFGEKDTLALPSHPALVSQPLTRSASSHGALKDQLC